jgi:hypothetical protein
MQEYAEAERIFDRQIPHHNLLFGGIIGVVELFDVTRRHNSKWFVGPFGWCFENPRPLSFIKARGKLGLFNSRISIVELNPRQRQLDLRIQKPHKDDHQ